MALIETTGTVKRIINGYGFVLEEHFKDRNGEARSNFFTVWDKQYEANGVSEGDSVIVRGALSVKIDEFTGRDGEQKKVAAAHINSPTVQKDNPF